MTRSIFLLRSMATFSLSASTARRHRFRAFIGLAMFATGAGWLAGQPVSLPGNSSAGNSPRAPGADVAWTALQSSWSTVAQGKSTPADWNSVAAAAQKFQHDFPNDPQTRSAGKVAANALIHADDNLPALSTNARSVATTYIADFKNAAPDRVDVEINLEQAKLRRAQFTSREQWLAAHAAHARELMREFPDQPEGYGYLLSLAKTESTFDTHALADELLKSPAPAAYAAEAHRILHRLSLVGRPLVLTGAEPALAAAKGKVLVLYTWRNQDDGFLAFIQRYSAVNGLTFIGINLDASMGPAKGKAAVLRLPGPQFYDGGNLNGPLAQQLQLIMGQSLYLIDRGGVVRDVNGQHALLGKLSQLLAEGAQR